jgi:hypothetical protein
MNLEYHQQSPTSGVQINLKCSSHSLDLPKGYYHLKHAPYILVANSSLFKFIGPIQGF